MKVHEVVIIGASAAGLACAARLKLKGIPYALLEQSIQVGQAWRNHYDRLHLHTNKEHSGLPFLPFSREVPKYPSKQEVIEYLEHYTQELGLNPEFGTEVLQVKQSADTWHIETNKGTYSARQVIFATGYNRAPVIPKWPGQEQFRGKIIHSSVYKNGAPYQGKDVLVVGFGNSAGEIAICLHEHGAKTHLSVKGPVNIIPRDILGFPVLSIGIKQAGLPSKLVDMINAPLLRLLLGDYTKYGLQKLPYGPTTQIRKYGRIPLLDVGTLKLIKKGQIVIHPDIAEFNPDGVTFTNGQSIKVQAVILGTGYKPKLDKILIDHADLLDQEGTPLVSGKQIGQKGIYFCGFFVAPTGMLREINLESARISDEISKNYIH